MNINIKINIIKLKKLKQVEKKKALCTYKLKIILNFAR